MVRHIVAWNYKEGFSALENEENAQKVKFDLEALIQCIDGILEMKVYINNMSSSNKDIVLNSLFESAEALEAYQIHPEHKKIGAYIGTIFCNKACIDYFE